MRRARLSASLATALVVISGCDGDAVGERSAEQPEQPSRVRTQPDVSSTGVRTGQLVVRVRVEGAYRDGAYHYVRVEDATGETVVERQYRRDDAVRLVTRLAAGSYRTISWQRPCQETCPRAGQVGLDAPTDICGTKLELVPAGRATVDVRLQPGVGCTASADVN